MKKMQVKDIRNWITKNASVVREDAPIKEVAKEILKDPKTQVVYVVNKNEKLVGLIPVTGILQYLFYDYIPVEFITYSFPLALTEDIRAKDIMLPSVYVKDNESVKEAFRIMFENKLMELPVVDSNMHVIGDLNTLELIE